MKIVLPSMLYLLSLSALTEQTFTMGEVVERGGGEDPLQMSDSPKTDETLKQRIARLNAQSAQEFKHDTDEHKQRQNTLPLSADQEKPIDITNIKNKRMKEQLAKINDLIFKKHNLIRTTRGLLIPNELITHENHDEIVQAFTDLTAIQSKVPYGPEYESLREDISQKRDILRRMANRIIPERELSLLQRFMQWIKEFFENPREKLWSKNPDTVETDINSFLNDL